MRLERRVAAPVKVAVVPEGFVKAHAMSRFVAGGRYKVHLRPRYPVESEITFRRRVKGDFDILPLQNQVSPGQMTYKRFGIVRFDQVLRLEPPNSMTS
jgi:hypothetical protein